ncbi:SGNH/GDSL hydrolase family protein [Longimicrobium sp.]|jgi:lysophospholipase L1-like esterase|uniref:SGNH/GDSL hydrolase family protein n=1 Tax=Longimicrobium sp. TaxID=2029185 RepID=UPI002F959282
MSDLLIRSAAKLSLLLSPILYVQGRRLKRTMPRLPDASGARGGLAPGGTPPLRLLIVGDSAVAGVGAAELNEALVGQLVQNVAARTKRAVPWQMLGRRGITARGAEAMLMDAELSFAPDVVVLVVGMNDVLQMRDPSAWRSDMRRLLAAVRARCGSAPIVLAGLPPVGRIPVLPQPMRAVLGMSASILNGIMLELRAETRGVRFAPAPPLARDQEKKVFCEDGLHPSPYAYARWAEVLGGAVLASCDDVRAAG